MIYKFIHDKILNNRLLFVGLVLFSIFTTFLALTNNHNTAPDEIYHYAATAAYTHQLSPVISHQTLFAETGDLTRNPSYFYHYLFSFPLRLINNLGFSYYQGLLLLRLLNVMLGIITLLVLFLFLKQVTARHVASVVTVVFALLPVTVLIYSGLNYDNLLLFITFLSFYSISRLTSNSSLSKLLALGTLLILGCITKFTFTPIAFIIVIYLIWYYRKPINWKIIVSNKGKHVALIFIVFMLSFALFSERYVGNLVKYHNASPACAAIQKLDNCLQYSVVKRDYDNKINNTGTPRKNIAEYALINWLPKIDVGLAFRSLIVTVFLPPITIIGACAAIIYKKSGFKSKAPGHFFLTLAGLYTITLLLYNYSSYSKSGAPNGISGRYLLPVLPLLLVPVISALILLIESRPKVIKSTTIIIIALSLLSISNTLANVARAQDSTIHPVFRTKYIKVRNILSPYRYFF